MIDLAEHLKNVKASGRKILVVYVTAGLRDDWQECAAALVRGGADAVEIGIPFSDPVMDGPVIQQASNESLSRGTTPTTVFDDLVDNQIGAPLAVMTYFNLVHKFGLTEFAQRCKSAGVSGAILPDLSLDGADEWRIAAGQANVSTVFLAAPNSSDSRLQMVCDASKGFVYAVGSLGVTGQRQDLSDSARQIGDRARSCTDKPVLIGVGVSSPEQAGEASRHSDGVVVGTAVVKALAEGASPSELEQLANKFRNQMDSKD